MSEKTFRTRKKLVDAVRVKNPSMSTLSDDQVYQTFIKKYPEYIRRVDENSKSQFMLEQEAIQEQLPTGEKKTAFTAVAELFSGDGYKYIPYIRDAELIEFGSILARANKLQNGTADDEDIEVLKGWVSEENTPRSWGYNTLSMMLKIPAYFIEFRTVIGGFKNISKGISKVTVKAGQKKFIKAATERAVIKTVRSSMKKAATSAAGKFAKESVEQAARNQFHTTLSDAAKMASKRQLKLSLKGTLTGVAQGMREAAVKNVFRSPQAVNMALQKMMPTMQLSRSLDDELSIEILDEGDNLIPALLKAYGEQQIEFFTESVGDSLRLAHHLWRGEVLKLKPGQLLELEKPIVAAAKSASAKADELIQAPIKAAIAKAFLRVKTPDDLKKILRTGGWNGVIEEMYEERVGDILRASTGLQENWLPSPDQLASEAVAFALFGAGSSAAYAAAHSRALGGAGIQTYLENIGEISPEGEEAIRTTADMKTVIDRIVSRYEEERNNPSLLLRAMRGAANKINSLIGTDLDPNQRGGINDLMMRVTGSTLTAHIAAAVENGTSPKEAAKTYLETALQQMGTYVVADEETKAKRQKALRDNLMERVELPGKRFYLIDASVWDEKALQEQGFVVGSAKAIKQIADAGLLEGDVIDPKDYSAKTGQPGYRNAITSHSRIFNLISREDARDSYGLIQRLINSKAAEDHGIKFVIRPGVVIRDTNKALAGMGYGVEGNPEDIQEVLIGASNEGGVVNLSPTSQFADIFEDFTEAVIKSENAMWPETSGVEFKRISTQLQKANKSLIGFSPIEVVVKTYMAKRGIRGNYRNYLFKQATDPGNVIAELTDYVEEIIGKETMDLINEMVVTQESEKKAEKEPAAKEEVKKPKKAPEKPSDQLDAQPAKEPASTADEEPESYSLKEFAAKRRAEAESFVSGTKSFDDLKADYAEFAGNEQYAPEQIFDIEMAGPTFTANELEFYLNAEWDAIAFSDLDADEPEETSEVEEFGSTAKLSNLQKVKIHTLARELNRLIGQGDAQRLLIDMTHNNKRLVRSLITADGFAEFMNSIPETHAEKLLQKAIRNLDADMETVRDTLRFFSNITTLPVVKLRKNEFGNINLLQLNRFVEYEKFSTNISRHLDLKMKHMDEFRERTSNKSLTEKPSRWLAETIGLTFDQWDTLSPSVTASIRRQMVEIIRDENMAQDTMKDRIIAALSESYAMPDGSTRSSAFQQIATLSQGSNALSPMFYNINGDMTSATKMESHLIDFARQYASTLGLSMNQYPVLASLDGFETAFGSEKFPADTPVGENVEFMLRELFKRPSVKVGGAEFYHQWVGRLGDKGQVYVALARKHSANELRQALPEYRAYYESFDSAVAAEFLLSPADFKHLIEIDLYRANYVLNKSRINKIMHGDLTIYKTMQSFVKRSSQIPTDGERFKGTWNILVVKDIDNTFDGMALFSDRFGTEYAKYMGPNSMRGAEKATAIKAHISNADGSRELIKTNWINISELKGVPFYEDMALWLELYKDNHNEEIDLVVFDSGVKLSGRETVSLIKNENGRFKFEIQPNAELSISKLDGRQFITSQWLNHTSHMHMRNLPKQMHTDLLHMDSSATIAELFNQIFEYQLSDIGDSFGTLTTIENSEEIDGKEYTSMLKELISEDPSLEWMTGINPETYHDVFEAIVKRGENIRDPRYSTLLEAIRARYIQSKLSRTMPGTAMQMVSDADSFLPTYREVDGKIALPWAIANMPHLRTAQSRISSRGETERIIRENPEKYWDMFEYDSTGARTDKILTHEIFEDTEKRFGGGWVIPGEIITGTRIPADNVHSHSVYRLYRSTSPGSTSNLMIIPKDIMKRKGGDFDGDKEYVYGRVKWSNKPEDLIRNKILALIARDFMNPKYKVQITASVDVQNVFAELAAKYEKEQQLNKQTNSIYSNTLEGDLFAIGVNADSKKALGAVAAGGRVWDYAHSLGMPLSHEFNGLRLYGIGSNAITLKFTADGIASMSPAEKMLRKLYYQTALINVTVDNANRPIMHSLNMTQETTPMMQALIALNEDLRTEAQLEAYIDRIVSFFKSPVMIDYTAAIRSMKTVGFVRPEVETKSGGKRSMSNEEYIERYLTDRHSINTVAPIMKLHTLMQEARDISQMYNIMYNAPADYAQFMAQKQTVEKMANNQFEAFMTSAAWTRGKENHFTALVKALQYHESHSFADNVLKTNAGKKILQLAPAYLTIKEDGLRKISKITNRAIAVASLQFAEHVPPATLADTVIQLSENPKYRNRFTDMLVAIGSGEKRRLEIAEKFRYSDIDQETIDQARKDFDQMPVRVKQVFSMYAYLMYGISSSTFTGSYAKLIGPEFSRYINEQIINTIDNMQQERSLLPYAIAGLTKDSGLMNWTGNFLRGSALEKMSLEEIDRVRQSESPKTDRPESYSLQEFHRAVTSRSMVLFSGAKGLHKLYIDELNKMEASRYNGRKNREIWEIKTGVRKSFNRDEHTDAADQKRGRDMLAAAISILEGTDIVIVGNEVTEMSLNEAFQIRRNALRESFPEYYYTTPVDYDESFRINEIRSRELNMAPIRVENFTIAEAQEQMLYIRMARWMNANRKTTFPINRPIYDGRSPEEIARTYDSSKKEWMISSQELIRQIREAFDHARTLMNHDMLGRFAEWIGYQENYVPHYYAFEHRETDGPVTEKEELSRREKRIYKSYKDAAEQANLVPFSVNIAELYEKWMNEAAHAKYLESAWGVLLMGSTPSGQVSVIPKINADSYANGEKTLFPIDMLDAVARRIAFEMNREYKINQDPISFLNSIAPSESEYELMETNIESMPQVWVMRDQTRNIIKMMVGKKHDGIAWRLWERMNAWTKFMAIGFPYMSYFHKAALLESAVAIKGLKNSPAYHPVKVMEEFKSFRNMLSSNPDISEWWIRHGLQAKDTHPDYEQGIVNRDLAAGRDKLAENHPGLAGAISRFIEIKKTWDNNLWQDFHTPLKIWAAEGIMQEFRAKAAEDGIAYNESMVAKEIAAKIDDAFGGQLFQRNLWATPKVNQVISDMLFAYDWTISALGVAGIKNIPGFRSLLGAESPITNDIMFGKYWPAFAAIVLFGIPNALQALIWAITRPVGGDDDDRPFNFLNEEGRKTWIDISPLTRAFTGERRVYLRWGKQAYEVFEGWASHPIQSLGHKTSMTVKTAYEQVTGQSTGGWDLPFKGLGLAGVLEAQGSFAKSRAGNIALKFVPFAVQDLISGKPTAWFAKAKYGASEFAAQKQLTEMYLGYVDDKNWDVTKDHEASIIALGSGMVEAAYRNGYNGQAANEKALNEARSRLYPQLLEEIKKNKTERAERTAQKILSLNGTAAAINRYIAANF